MTDAARLVAGYGGSMSGEHGDGRARSELLPLMYSAAVLALFAQVKALFDPDDLLNPGVLVRPGAAGRRRPGRRGRAASGSGLALAYRHDGGDLAAAVHRCTGVGKCRADLAATGAVMCPSFQATREEKDSTRGRARVLQELLAPGGPVRDWRVARGARRARPVPVLQGLRPRLPDRDRHGVVQVGGAAPVVPAPAASPLALHARPAAPLGRPRAPGRPGWSTP